jgi:hypothetical protein
LQGSAAFCIAAFDEQGKENLRLLNDHVGRIQNLIHGVLQYSRVG